MSSPKNSLQCRLELRERVSLKLENNVFEVIDEFLSYELDYYSTLQVISTYQYLQLCRKANSLPNAKLNHIAYINYSLLSLSLEAPVSYQEFFDSVKALQALDKSKIPPYLAKEIDSILSLIPTKSAEIEGQYQSQTDEIQDETNEIKFIEASSIDMSSLFESEPKNNDLLNSAVEFATNLDNNLDVDILVQNFANATSSFTDFSCLLDYFSLRTELYPKFTAFLLAVSNATSENSSNEFRLKIFEKKFRIPKAKSYIREAFESIVSIYNVSIPVELPMTFNAVLLQVLDTCAEITDDPIYHVLASLQSTSDHESIVRYIKAFTFLYDRQEFPEPSFVMLGIELFLNPRLKRKCYAIALLQMVKDESILHLIKSSPILVDDIMEIMPYFYDFDLLSVLLADIKERKDLILGYLSKTIDQRDKIAAFNKLCIMKLLNTLNKEFGISQLDIFHIVS